MSEYNFQTAAAKVLKADIIKANVNKLKLGEIEDVEKKLENVEKKLDELQIDANSDVNSVNGVVGNVILCDARGLDTTENDLWSTIVKTDENGNIYLDNKQLDGSSWWLNLAIDQRASITAIKGKQLLDSAGNVVANVEFDKVDSAQSMMGGLNNLSSVDFTYFTNIHDALAIFGMTGYSAGPIFSQCNNVNLKNAWRINDAFANCGNLETFEGHLPEVTHGERTFEGCVSLTTFNAVTPKMKYGDSMFYDCPNLTEFHGDLSSLESGIMMFNSAKLDEDSLYCISKTIKNAGEVTGDATYTLDLGTVVTEEIAAPYIQTIENKGWTVHVVYYGQMAATLDLDAEPIEWYCSLAYKLTKEEIAEKKQNREKYYQPRVCEWVAPDGRKCELLMYNYVTDKENYFKCYSQAEAVEHFGLVPNE